MVIVFRFENCEYIYSTLEDNKEMLNRVAEPANKNFAFGYPSHQQLIKKQLHDGVSSLQTKYFMDHSVFMLFGSDSPFFETVRDLSFRMMAAGMFRRDLSTIFGNYDESEPEDIGPQVLTMDHLGIGFLACLVPMTAACIAFFGEIFFSRVCTRSKRNMKSQKRRKKQNNSKKKSHQKKIFGFFVE